jgi:hypothetical protein
MSGTPPTYLGQRDCAVLQSRRPQTNSGQRTADTHLPPNNAPRFAERGRRVLDSGQVGQGPQTTVYLPSEPSRSRVTWHRSGGPLLEEEGPVYPEELPNPSTVTGAVPLGAPVTVSWAAAGVADTTAQTAAIDINVKTMISGGYNLLAAIALVPGTLCSAFCPIRIWMMAP